MNASVDPATPPDRPGPNDDEGAALGDLRQRAGQFYNKLIEAGLKATGLKTRRELVDFALRELLRHKQQMKLLSLKGKVTWEGDLAEMRTGRGQ